VKQHGVPSKKPLAVAVLSLLACSAQAVSLDEAIAGDFSGNGLAPTVFVLDMAGASGTPGHNVLSGRTGRGASGVDRDYLKVIVPEGFFWSGLRVGQQTTSGGGIGAFIGLAAGPQMTVSTSATSAAGLLGFRHYSAADRGTDILDDMAVPAAGSLGFTVPLVAGEYTLWIQELASGSFAYRFNLMLSPVPEPTPTALLLAGLAGLAALARARRRSEGGLLRAPGRPLLLEITTQAIRPATAASSLVPSLRS